MAHFLQPQRLENVPALPRWFTQTKHHLGNSLNCPNCQPLSPCKQATLTLSSTFAFDSWFRLWGLFPGSTRRLWMLILGDKSRKKFRATERSKNYPCPLHLCHWVCCVIWPNHFTLSIQAFHPSVSPMTRQSLPWNKTSNYGNTRETLLQAPPSALISKIKPALRGHKIAFCIYESLFADNRIHRSVSGMRWEGIHWAPKWKSRHYESLLCHPWAVWSQANYLTLPCLSFPSCKSGLPCLLPCNATAHNLTPHNYCCIHTAQGGFVSFLKPAKHIFQHKGKKRVYDTLPWLTLILAQEIQETSISVPPW